MRQQCLKIILLSYNQILRNRRAICDMAGSRKPRLSLALIFIFIFIIFIFPLFPLLLPLWSHCFLQLGPTFLLSTIGRRISILACVKRCIFPSLSYSLLCCNYIFRVFICLFVLGIVVSLCTCFLSV